ncbi:MAG: hypothetical protein ACRYHQ_14625 [Janthinobacterium lividum]
MLSRADVFTKHGYGYAKQSPGRRLRARLCGLYVLWAALYLPNGFLALCSGTPPTGAWTAAYLLWLPFNFATGAAAAVYIFWPALRYGPWGRY